MPSPPRDLILLLPFTQALLESPRPILSLIYSSLRRHQSLDSLLVYFSSPCAPHASFDGDTPADVDSESSKGQLYDQLRSRPRATWVAFQRFLSVIYSTLAAAQWEGANEGDGRIHVRVDVGFEGKEGRWEGRFDVCDEMVVLEGEHPPFVRLARVMSSEGMCADTKAMMIYPILHSHRQRRKLLSPAPLFRRLRLPPILPAPISSTLPAPPRLFTTATTKHTPS
jgi:hypothetical protein